MKRALPIATDADTGADHENGRTELSPGVRAGVQTTDGRERAPGTIAAPRQRGIQSMLSGGVETVDGELVGAQSWLLIERQPELQEPGPSAAPLTE